MSSLLRKKLGQNFDCLCVFQPNAPFNVVLNNVDCLAREFSNNDYVFILAGTNNTSDTFVPNDFNIFNLEPLPHRTNIFVFSIPFCYDMPWLSSSILEANNILRSKVNNPTNVTFTETSFLKRSDFTNHGLHLCESSKQKLSSMLADFCLPSLSPSAIPIIVGKKIKKQFFASTRCVRSGVPAPQHHSESSYFKNNYNGVL